MSGPEASRTEQGLLFEQERTYGVGEVAARLTRAVASAFPAEVWVRGEIDGLRRPNANGHVYFSLCERNSRKGPTTTLAVSLFRQDRLRVERELRSWPGFSLADGLEVRVKGRVQYGYGRVSLVMSAVDPVHTLGRLAADRERVLRALAADGLLEANRALPLPRVPLRVAVVTSVGSAAYEDVVHELEASDLGFEVAIADARVQGTGAELSLVRALTLVARAARPPDVVLLVRGGGSRTDLAVFDGERLARAIAAMPVPVLTGIGHEIDASVADEVAHTSYKTPTAAAAAVVDAVRLALARAEAAWASVTHRARLGVVAADERLARAAAALERDAGARCRDAAGRLDARARHLQLHAAAACRTATGRLDAGADRLDAAAEARLAGAATSVDDAARRLAPARLDAGLRRLDADLGLAARRVARAATTGLAAADRHLDVLAAHVGAADPARALARGWTMTRTADGTLVRRAADLRPGDTLVTSFADGRAESTVAAVHAPDPERP